MKKITVTVTTMAVAFGLSFCGVSAVSALTDAQSEGNAVTPRLPDPSTAASPQFKTNASGQTYGSALKAPTYQQLPELTRVVTDQGGVGYAYTSQLDGPSPKGLAVTDSSRVTVTAYRADGKTKVGTYTFGGPGR